MQRLRADLRDSVPLFAALGDVTRLTLVTRLAAGEALSIKRLSEGTQVTRQAITRHLHVLEDAGLVRGSKHGREQLWELNPRQLAKARRAIDLIARRWEAALLRLKNHVEQETLDG
jgi:DNA-binding transcriptional ArsR family regulator